MIRAVVFDIGNVLLKFDFSQAIRRIASQCTDLHATVLEAIEPLKEAYESGLISRGEFLKRVQQHIGFTGSEAEFVGAWQDIFTENTPMSEVVRALHGKLPLYLLSNTSDIHVDYMLEKYPLFGLFTDAVYSYRVGCVKPGTAIYKTALRQFGVEPSSTVFIDDLLPNIETARGLGFEAIHYRHDEHGALLERLRQLGLPLEGAQAYR